jgi:hypothetical protein
MKIQEHIPHFVKEHKKAIAIAVGGLGGLLGGLL